MTVTDKQLGELDDAHRAICIRKMRDVQEACAEIAVNNAEARPHKINLYIGQLNLEAIYESNRPKG